MTVRLCISLSNSGVLYKSIYLGYFPVSWEMPAEILLIRRPLEDLDPKFLPLLDRGLFYEDDFATVSTG